MTAKLLFIGFAVLLAATWQGHVAAQVTWDGGGGTDDTNWSTGANWEGDLAPSNPTTGTIIFSQAPLALPPIPTATNTPDPIAALTSTTAEPYALTDQDQLGVAANGGGVQIFTFNSVDFPDIADALAVQVANVINFSAVGFEAVDQGGTLMLRSTVPPGSLQVSNVSGRPAADLGLTTDLTTTGTWTIAALNVQNDGGSHTCNLDGNTLAVVGDPEAGDRVQVSSAGGGETWADMTFTNGTLQIGTADAPLDVVIGTGNGTNYGGRMRVGSGATLVSNIGELIIGDGDGGRGELDLRGGAVAGGVLQADRIILGIGGHENIGGRFMHILLDDTTSISKIRTRHLHMATGPQQNARIGDPDNDFFLPAGVSIEVGSDEAPGQLYIGLDARAAVTAELKATGGGTFTGRVESARFGASMGSGSCRAILDIAAMDSIGLTVDTDFTIVIDNGQTTAPVEAVVKLPPGTVSAAGLNVSVPLAAVGGAGHLLELNGTRFEVNTATIGTDGVLNTNVNGFSCGLDLPPGDQALAVNNGGILHINFALPQDRNESGEYYGLRWQGDHVAELSALVDAGKLTWDDSGVAAGDAARIYADDLYTYVSVREQQRIWTGGGGVTDTNWSTGANWAGDLPPGNPTTDTIIFGQAPLALPAIPTAVNTPDPIAAIISTSAEPYALTHLDQLGVAANGGDVQMFTFPSQLFADIGNAPAQEVADIINFSAVGFVAVDFGGTLMLRSTVAPGSLQVSDLSGTPAADLGLTKDLTTDGIRIIGGLDVRNDDGTHICDLGGSTLAIVGDPGAGDRVQVTSATEGDKWGAITFTNGTLKIGTPDLPLDVVIGTGVWSGGGGFKNRGGRLKIGDGATLDADIGELRIGDGAGARGELDLRGGAVAGGVLRADRIILGIGWEQYILNRFMHILLDADTVTNSGGALTIKTRDLEMANSTNQHARIGDPANDFFLPAGVSIEIGSEADPGSLRMGLNPQMGCTAELKASGGGTFTGYVTDVRLGAFMGLRYSSNRSILDIAAMDSINLTVINDFTIAGGTGPVVTATINATVKLPPGTVSAAYLNLSVPLVSGEHLLELNGTRFEVGDAATIGTDGVLNTNVNGFSCGLDLADGATLAVNNGGTLHLNFAAQQDAGESGEYYGLRWEGDHETELSALIGTGRITWDVSSAVTGTVWIADDGTYTYVALREVWEPTALIKNLSVEVGPGPTSVTIGVDDVDGSKDDPGVTSVTLESPSDTDGVIDDRITVSTNGASTHQMTLTRNRADGSASDTGTLSLILTPWGTEEDVTWSGLASTALMDRPEWFWGANWVGGEPPSNPSAGTITFGDAGAAMENLLEAGRIIGALNVSNTAGTHTFNLNGNTLSVNGDTAVSTPTPGTPSAVFKDGTLQIGTPDIKSNLTINPGSLVLEPGCTFDANIDSLQMNTATLDLRGVTILGGILKASSISMGLSPRSGLAQILLDDSTEITALEAGSLVLGEAQGVTARIGEPANGFKLPPNIDVTIGSETARGVLRIAQAAWPTVDSRLIASSGGDFTAWLTEMNVGGMEWSGTTCIAKLDISTMDSVMINCSGTFMMPLPNTSLSGSVLDAECKLPGGTVTTRNLHIGVPFTVGPGARLELNSTLVTVTEAAEVGQRGEIITNVNGFSCGVDLAAAASLSLSSPGKIQINFNAAHDPGEGGEYWGLRWQGNHRTVIRGMMDGGRIVADTTGSGGTAGVWYDGTYTYVSIKEAWPPIAKARDLTHEVNPPDDTTLVISVDDVDDSPHDPDVTGRTITCPDDEDGDPATVTLTTAVAATFDITLTLTQEDGLQGSDDATLTVTLIPDGTTGNLTWAGGASTARMDRPEWFWGANWVGGVPPVNPTPATITFGNAAAMENLLEAGRIIGALNVSNTAGTHTFNINGNTLSVSGNTVVNTPMAGAVFTDGTLQIGTPDTKSNLTINPGSLVLEPGCTFDANIGSLEMTTATLDLRGVTIAGGILKADSISMGLSNFSGPVEILLDDATAITALEAGSLVLGQARGVTARIGDPATGYKLPPNTDVTVGSETARGVLRIGQAAWATVDSRLIASSGGDFTAWLTEMNVGGMEFGGSSIARLDISTMDSVMINCSGTFMMPWLNTEFSGSSLDAECKLPGGTVTTSNLHIGVPETVGPGARLELNGTVFSVITEATVGSRGTVRTNVSGTSCGLDLGPGATLSVADGGVVDIVFDGIRPKPGMFWGLRMVGDHVAELQVLKTYGRLTWDDTAVVGHTVSIFEDAGSTYVGFEVVGVPGDVNGDCVVNILDLIGIRNHLNQDPTTPPENAAFDVNHDGAINILDMIFVRNRLNDICPTP